MKGKESDLEDKIEKCWCCELLCDRNKVELWVGWIEVINVLNFVI